MIALLSPPLNRTNKVCQYRNGRGDYGSGVVALRLTAAKYKILREQAKRERRKITNLIQVMVEEGLEKRVAVYGKREEGNEVQAGEENVSNGPLV